MTVHGPLGVTEAGAFELRRDPGLNARTGSSRTRLGLLGLSGLLASGLAVSVTAAGTDSLLPESIRPVPQWLAGPFGATGLGLGVGALMGVLALMFASYALVVHASDRLSARSVLMCIAALHALVLLAPPLVSTDVFSYQAYARMGSVYGTNPFIHGPSAISLDPVYPFIGAKWVTTPTVYGPVFTVLSYSLAHASIAASALAYKAIAALSSLAIVAIVWNAARLRGVDQVRAAALVGLNPLLVVYGVGGGHNDMLMLALAVGGVALLIQHRDRLGAGSIVLATGVKFTSGLLLPFALAGAGGRLSRSRRRDVLVGGGIAAAAVLALGLAVFGVGPLHLFSSISKSQSEGDWHSIPGFISMRMGMSTIGHVTGIVLAVVFVGVFCRLLQRVWRGELDWVNASAWMMVALLITASSLLPWYVAWLLPLAALATDRRLWRVSVVMTGAFLAIQVLGYIPHSISLPGL
jgi:Glycosyltransferase family 87